MNGPICVFFTWTDKGGGAVDAVSGVTIAGSAARPAATVKSFTARFPKGSPVAVEWTWSSGDCRGVG